MVILAACAITAVGTISRSFRHTIGGLAFWLCVAITLLTVYGMFLP